MCSSEVVSLPPGSWTSAWQLAAQWLAATIIIIIIIISSSLMISLGPFAELISCIEQFPDNPNP